MKILTVFLLFLISVSTQDPPKDTGLLDNFTTCNKVYSWTFASPMNSIKCKTVEFGDVCGTVSLECCKRGMCEKKTTFFGFTYWESCSQEYIKPVCD